MSELGDASSVISKVVIGVVFLVALVVSIKKLRAKTAMQSFVLDVIFASIILAPFLIAFIWGDLQLPDFDAVDQSKMKSPMDAIGELKPIKIILIGCAFALWVIGHTVLMKAHWRRINKKPKIFENPFTPQYAEFNLQEWAILAGIVVGGLGLAFAALIA